ncbi:mas-related G-protein coupled receptor member H-like [Varanus komodoensis]|uniref:mas-related G-protein coupled receptor member H-like n=1 Tax=Varanus komodoensis TaxID=61221 RepID=UPI001CF7A45C|nr:mas-related G-protein coupled receptor member H-like [Varanus komodoensis]
MKQDQELFSHGLNVMTNFSGTCMLTELNVTADSYNPGSVFVWPMLQYFLCILGLVGNGNVIWLLAFHIKRNTFTTYVLNLALADSGVLIILLVIGIVDVSNHFVWHGFPFLDVQILYYLFGLMHGVGQFLLTTISIDRCASVLFPIWHRCRRPPHLSAIICTLIWALWFLVYGVHMILFSMSRISTDISPYVALANGLICFPVMTISSLTLFIKVYFKSHQSRRGKLIKTILLALLFFLILAFPLTVIYVLGVFFDFHFLLHCSIWHLGLFCASLNSSVNPLIYFLVGRNRRSPSTESMKFILQRVFKEQENSEGDLEPRVQIQL